MHKALERIINNHMNLSRSPFWQISQVHKNVTLQYMPTNPTYVVLLFSIKQGLIWHNRPNVGILTESQSLDSKRETYYVLESLPYQWDTDLASELKINYFCTTALDLSRPTHTPTMETSFPADETAIDIDSDTQPILETSSLLSADETTLATRSRDSHQLKDDLKLVSLAIHPLWKWDNNITVV